MESHRIEVETEVSNVPPWATLERELIGRINQAVHPIIDEYVKSDGSVYWPPADDYVGIDAVDDVYEGFWNWPLFYALGGARHVFDYAFEEFEAITKQFSEIPTGLGHPQIVDDYQQGHDWFHQSEGYLLFYHLCLAAPDNERLNTLAQRYAGLYLNEIDGVPDNYDVEHDLLYCPMNGSMGPAYHNFSDDVPPPMYHAHSETRIPWQYSEWKEHYGLPYYDLDGIDEVADLRDPEKARRMGEAIRDRCAQSDTPQNLGVTGMIANAFLLTGSERYREWVSDYVGAWLERVEENDGLLPDNVDHEGTIGGATGRWYGGWYGWSWPHGWRSLGAALVGAAETAVLLTGDRTYLDLPRSQLRHLVEKGREGDEGFEIPHRFADAGALPRERGQAPDEAAGWFQYRTERPGFPAHIWYASMEPADRERLELLAPSDTGLRAAGKALGGNEAPWAAYVRGEHDGYPVRMLQHNLDLVNERIEFVEADDEDPTEYGDWYLQARNPVVTEALVQLTMGAPQAVYNGGMTVGTVRHFDPEADRPGLPPGVAALVSRVGAEDVTVDLVNTDEERRVVFVQAGGYGEHRFSDVTVTPLSGDGGSSDPDDGTVDAVNIDLAPGAGARLTAGLDRYGDTPTYAPPWDR